MKLNLNKMIEYITDPKTRKIPLDAAMIKPHQGKRAWSGKNTLRIYDSNTLASMFSDEQRSRTLNTRERLALDKMTTFETETGISFSPKDVDDGSYIDDVVLLVATMAYEVAKMGGEISKENENTLNEFISHLTPEQRERGQEILKQFNDREATRGEEFRMKFEGSTETLTIPAKMVTQLKQQLGIRPLTPEDKAQIKKAGQQAFDSKQRTESERRTAELAAIQEIERNTREFEKENKRLMDMIQKRQDTKREKAYDLNLGHANDLLHTIKQEVQKVFALEIAHLGQPKKGSIAEKQLIAITKANRSLESLDTHFEKDLNRRNIDNFSMYAVELNVLTSNLQAELTNIGYPKDSKLDKVLKAVGNGLKSFANMVTNIFKSEKPTEAPKKDLKTVSDMTRQYRTQIQQLADKTSKDERPDYSRDIPKPKK